MPNTDKTKNAPIKIVQKDDPVLRKKLKDMPLADITSAATKSVIARMSAALYASENGIGIAAPQIGVSLPIFLISEEAIAHDKDDASVNKKKTDWKHVVFINPKLIKRSVKKDMLPEGCLSVDGVFGNIKRSRQVVVEAHDENGKKFRVGASGLYAQVLQHETDHLNGILFIDSAKDLENFESLGARDK